MTERAGACLVQGRVACELLMIIVAAGACAPGAEGDPPGGAVTPTFNEETGRLELLAYDSNDNGQIDAWTYMDGTRVMRTEIDANEDGLIERWEYYGEGQVLEKVGFSRSGDGVVDAWAYEGLDGAIARVELSSQRDDTIDRWEFYEDGVMVRAEEDTDRDSTPDKWETFTDGRLETVAFDEDSDGRPDRRLTYGPRGTLVLVERAPDASGRFQEAIRPES